MAKDFFNDLYYENNDTSFVLEQDPKLKDDKHKTFFFAMQFPLCTDMVEKLLDLIKEIMAYEK